MHFSNMYGRVIYMCLCFFIFGESSAHTCQKFSGCPAGYGASFGGNCYKFVRERVDWHEAGRRCGMEGAGLVSIETQAEQQHLAGYINSKAYLRTDVLAANWRGYWTSANDIRKEGHWEWSATQRALSYRNFSDGNPSNSGGREHCMELMRAGWVWNDVPCNFQLSYICEISKMVFTPCQ